MTKKLAVVTGGMGGLGEAISIWLQGTGYLVAVTRSPGNSGVADWLGSGGWRSKTEIPLTPVPRLMPARRPC